MPNLFDKEKYVVHYQNLQLYLRVGLQLKKKNTPCIRIPLIIIAKSIYRILHEKNRIEIEKNGDKYGEALYKLMCNTVYGKNMEILRNRTDVRLLS